MLQIQIRLVLSKLLLYLGMYGHPYLSAENEPIEILNDFQTIDIAQDGSIQLIR